LERIGWVQDYIRFNENFPRVDWPGVYEYVDNKYPNKESHALWCGIANFWLEQLKNSLHGGYTVAETENFMLLHSETESYINTFSSSLENILRKIINTLEGIASDEGYGKYVVLIFGNQDLYYDYILDYYPHQGEFSPSSGVFTNEGYGHFVFPSQAIDFSEPIAAHELTHSLMSHLPLPTWLNEGIAVSTENALYDSAPLILNNKVMSKLYHYWSRNDIQKFWSGESFYMAGDGSQLSYQLSQIMVNHLSKDYGCFREFCNTVSYVDSGGEAFLKVYGSTLEELIVGYFGPGMWAPDPDKWNFNTNLVQND